jgi:hypothetical protein
VHTDRILFTYTKLSGDEKGLGKHGTQTSRLLLAPVNIYRLVVSGDDGDRWLIQVHGNCGYPQTVNAPSHEVRLRAGPSICNMAKI